MGALGRLLTVLGLIVILMIGATLARGPAGELNAHWGALQISTTMPVALGLFLAALVLAYYFGQLAFYLGGLPGMWRAGRGHKKRSFLLLEVAEALAAMRLGLTAQARRRLTEVEADEPGLQRLAFAARLAAGENLAGEALPELMKKGSKDLLAAGERLSAAKVAAERADWPAVAEAAAQGLQQAPDSPRLLALRLKALINLDDLASAAALQSKLAAHLTPVGQRELQALVAPGEKITRTAEVPALSASATVRWEIWLANADDRLPGEPDGETA